jgi:RNA polymerase sigma factor (sigma-70 family)
MHLSTEWNDIELINAYKQTNNNNCIGILFERHSLMVFGVCMKYLEDEEDSKDAAAQIFEKLFVDIKKHQIDNFKSWLYSVTKNYCLMELRKVKNIKIIGGDISENISDSMEFKSLLHLSSNLDKLEDKLVMLEKAILLLNDKQQQCIALFYIQEKSYSEVAQITGFSLNDVKSYIQNGKRNLKLMLSKHE